MLLSQDPLYVHIFATAIITQGHEYWSLVSVTLLLFVLTLLQFASSSVFCCLCHLLPHTLLCQQLLASVLLSPSFYSVCSLCLSACICEQCWVWPTWVVELSETRQTALKILNNGKFCTKKFSHSARKYLFVHMDILYKPNGKLICLFSPFSWWPEWIVAIHLIRTLYNDLHTVGIGNKIQHGTYFSARCVYEMVWKLCMKISRYPAPDIDKAQTVDSMEMTYTRQAPRCVCRPRSLHREIEVWPGQPRVWSAVALWL